MGLHEILTSISCEIVGQNFVRGVISEAHVLGNDRIEFYSAVCLRPQARFGVQPPRSGGS